MNGIKSNLPNAPKRRKLSVALSKYPDVLRMLDRYLDKNPGHNQTFVIISAMRDWFSKRGYARKKDALPKEVA